MALLPLYSMNGVQFLAERRRYSTQTYTWVYFRRPDGEHEGLGDPWPCVTPAKTEVWQAYKSLKCYVGCHGATRKVFFSAIEPTEVLYPEFMAVIGPFATMEAAFLMARSGRNNPHLQCVEDAERLASSH